MEEAKLKETPHDVGDVVTFKAGGPAMIVIKKPESSGEHPIVRCEWFDINGHVKGGTFYQYQLIKKEIV